MCRLIALLITLAVAACAPAMTSEQREAAFRDDTARLVRLSLTERLWPRFAENYRRQVTVFLPAPVPESVSRTVGEEIDALLSQKMSDLEARLSTMFTRRFTPSEIRQLLAFYQSDVGRKSLALSEEMTGESREAILEWSRDFENVLLERLGTRFAEEGIEFLPGQE